MLWVTSEKELFLNRADQIIKRRNSTFSKFLRSYEFDNSRLKAKFAFKKLFQSLYGYIDVRCSSSTSSRLEIQQNLYKADTIGAKKCVGFIETSALQRFFLRQLDRKAKQSVPSHTVRLIEVSHLWCVRFTEILL